MGVCVHVGGGVTDDILVGLGVAGGIDVAVFIGSAVCVIVGTDVANSWAYVAVFPFIRCTHWVVIMAIKRRTIKPRIKRSADCSLAYRSR